jgi:hypothetical protein
MTTMRQVNVKAGACGKGIAGLAERRTETEKHFDPLAL